MKLMKVLVTALVMVGLVVPAIAEDKLSISGEFYVMGHMVENYSDFDSADDADKLDYFRQRLRLYSKYAVAEGVTIHTRMDFGEVGWGERGQNSVRYGSNQLTAASGADYEFQLDRAFLEIVKGPRNLRAGQQYYGFGSSIAVDHQGTGFRLAYGGPVSVTAFWNKIDEGVGALGANFSDELDSQKDRDIYGASVKYKKDAHVAELFYAKDDNRRTDANKDVIGLAFGTKLGPVNLSGEIHKFDGDDGGVVDYDGLQVILDGNAKVSDALTLGGKVFWAKGYDDKLQITELTDFGSINPEQYGYLETDFGIMDNVHNPFSLNAGTQSIMGYAAFKATDNLGFMFSAQYGIEEDDTFFEYDYTSFNLSAQYTIAKNTFFQVQGNYLSPDVEVGGVDADLDSAKGVVAKLLAKF